MVFVNIGTYSVSQDKREEFLALMKRISDHMKGNPDEFKPIKSHKLYTRSIGGVYGEFVDMWEFESWTEYEKYERTYAADRTWAGLWEEFMRLVEPSSHSWTNIVEVR
jgi:hypothetical protein